jgi:hypothetical protein
MGEALVAWAKEVVGRIERQATARSEAAVNFMEGLIIMVATVNLVDYITLSGGDREVP